MLRRRKGAPPLFRTAFAIAFCALAASLAASFDAEARPRSRMPGNEWRAGFSTIVVDGKTGDVIESTKADDLRHPASLTKIMTLYLLFSEIEAGRLKLNTKIKVSAEAAAQPPSKLGLKAGESIEIEQAIKALITRSANDVAVAVAEAVSGDEDSFAALMTRRARLLGMKQTVFKNASGLPHSEQVTTAREMALLSLAMQDRFPKLYPYFATRTFSWRGVPIGNHNRLLGSVDGVDGIKTGYTNASGFNLVTNVKRNGRHIVGVVLGGRTGPARDEMMRDLISDNIKHAHAGPRTAPRFVEARPQQAAPQRTADSAPSTQPSTQPSPGSGEAIRPNPVRLVQVGKGGQTVEAASDMPKSASAHVSALATGSLNEPLQISPVPVNARTAVALAPDGKRVTFAAPPTMNGSTNTSAQNSPEVPRTAYLSNAPFKSLSPKAPGTAEPPTTLNAQAQALSLTETPPQTGAFVKDAEPETPKLQVASADGGGAEAAIAKGSWIIQIGAYGKEDEAKERLNEARERAASALGKVRAYTEKTVRGTTAFFRARFAGLDEAGAKRACETLKKNDFGCFATRN